MKPPFHPFLVAISILFLSLTAGCKKSPDTPEPAPETSAAKEQPPKPALPTVSYADLGYDDGAYSFDEKPFTGVATEFHKNGKLSKRYEFKDGAFHGKVEEFYEDGQPMTLTHFDNNQRHGENTYWEPDGTVQKRQVYDHDTVIESTDPDDQKEIREREESKQ